MAKQETRVVSVHLPVDVVLAMEKVGERLERPKSWIMRNALSDWLRLEEARQKAATGCDRDNSASCSQ